MNDGMVHIAGDTLTMFGRYMRQRCLWCGDVIIEYDLERVAVLGPDNSPPATFPTGTLVLVNDNMKTPIEPEVIVEADGAQAVKLPDNACPHNPLTIPE